MDQDADKSGKSDDVSVNVRRMEKVSIVGSTRWLCCCLPRFVEHKDDLAESYHGPEENLRSQIHESKRNMCMTNNISVCISVFPHDLPHVPHVHYISYYKMMKKASIA